VAVATLPSSATPTFGTTSYRRYLMPVVVFTALVAIALVANHDVPSWLDIGAQKWIRDRYLWTVEHRDDHWLFLWFFNPIADLIDGAVGAMKSLLSALRWPGVVAAFAAIGWRTGGLRVAFSTGAAMLGVAVLGVWDAAMVTLSLMTVAVVIALIIGVPLGIWTARSRRAERFLRSFLDTAQVLPAFVYLSPLVVLFGIKYPPAVVATVIYAVPPAVRLTNLGIRSVAEVTNEVARSFGSTPWQQLMKVQLPMARRTLLLGLNQVIMLAFGIVVIASILGTDDLGRLVLNGLQKNDVGAAFVPGLAIVLLAVALDRASTGERVRRTRRPMIALPDVSRRVGSLIATGVVVASVAVAHLVGDGSFPASLVIDLSGTVNDAVGWVQNNIRRGVPVIGGTQTINDFLVADILEPIRSFLVSLPWLLIVVAVALIAWLSKGWQLALGCAFCLVMIGAMGSIGTMSLWDLAMDTLSQVLVAIVLSISIAVPLGILVGRSSVAEKIMRPFLDIAQVMPQFVYLIPVIFLFRAGRGAGVVAAVVYAVPPCIRLTGLGLRDVPFTPREAAISFGATPRQELRKVQLPLAFRSIMLGINQTIMMVLATVVIAGLVGAGALGLAAYEATTKPLLKIGSGTTAGVSIVLLAIVLDRITQAWGTGPDARERH
jgi:glycine betaine/proline transport system permease protein